MKVDIPLTVAGVAVTAFAVLFSLSHLLVSLVAPGSGQANSEDVVETPQRSRTVRGSGAVVPGNPRVRPAREAWTGGRRTATRLRTRPQMGECACHEPEGAIP